MDVDPILFSSLNEYIPLFKDQQDLFTLNLSLFALNQVEVCFLVFTLYQGTPGIPDTVLLGLAYLVYT